MGPGGRRRLLLWCGWLSLVARSGALELDELFDFGEEAGDQQLPPGSDSTAELLLNHPLGLFSKTFHTAYINTNGFVAVSRPPPEGEYLGKMPAEFKMIAALLGDLDNSDGVGKVHFRQDSSPDVLNRAAGHIRRAFPRDEGVEPSGVLVVTWENMAAKGTSGPAAKRNTFQLVVASLASSCSAILLYPRDGLQFFSAPVGQDDKLLEAGFNEGLVSGWFTTSQGTYYRTTAGEETALRELTTKTNSAQKGVWVYEIGTSPFFIAITPGMVTTSPEDEVETQLPVTMLPKQTDEPPVSSSATPEAPRETTTPVPGHEEDTPGESLNEFQTTPPEPENVSLEHGEWENNWGPEEPEEKWEENPESQTPTPDSPDQTEDSDPVYQTMRPRYTDRQPSEPRNPDPDRTDSRYTDRQPSEPRNPDPDRTDSRYTDRHPSEPRNPDPDRTDSRYIDRQPSEPRNPDPDRTDSRYTDRHPSEPRNPDPDRTDSRYTDRQPVQPGPPHLHPQHPHIVEVEEDEELGGNVFAYDLETCANNRHKCSAFADCRDYRDGYCCHCRPGYYGNGKECVAEGKPQRMNGKVNGRVFVGNSPSPVELHNNDLHSYVVANDGRAYVAISSVPDSLGPSLQPLASLGGVMGWAFALEQPGFQNGFSLIGGVFSRQAEVTFLPGNERLSIQQRFEGINQHDHLVVNTELRGRLPLVAAGSSVQVQSYQEIYHHRPNLITSSSDREYTVTSPDGNSENKTYQWRQTITFQGCPHYDAAAAAAPPTQRLSVDQIFVMFDAGNHLIRYAMSNKMGSVHSVPEQNPCFTGHHGCDISAVCRPGEGLHFTCECTAGFTGDGRRCQDVDECQSAARPCGHNAVCTNHPGSFRCECSPGFVFASDGTTCTEEDRPVDHCRERSHDCDAPERAECLYAGGSAYTCSCRRGYVGDGRTCRDVDECEQGGCHPDAFCSNTPGSYSCRCRPGFRGDGFHCNLTSSEREQSPCERLRGSSRAAASSGFLSFLRPAAAQYTPQCDERGAFVPTQCHGATGECWCVDADGHEIPDTRAAAGATPLCIDRSVAPPPVGPTPRPDVRPVAAGAHVLFAQSGKIEGVPLSGGGLKKDEAKTVLHIPDQVVIAVAYDCVERTVYWTDISTPSISRAGLTGGDVVSVVTEELQSPEGLAIDHAARLLFWTDSVRDTVEVSRLDGSRRRVLFDTDLVNPRPIVANPAHGRIYWADWNRDGPKIEMSNMDGTERSVLVQDDLGLPNGLTFDPDSQELCWADAGTGKVECLDPHRRLRKVVAEGVQYPFSVVSYGGNLYYTDWRRDTVVVVDRRSGGETDVFLPQRRSRLYGITTTTAQCPAAYNYCSSNGGCSQLCLPRPGGFSCRCPDAAEPPCDDE